MVLSINILKKQKKVADITNIRLNRGIRFVKNRGFPYF